MSNELTKSGGTLADVLRSDGMIQRIADVVPTHVTPERMMRAGLMALNRVPKLAQCSKESFLRCMMDCSSLGLEPDGRRCHLIPYKDTCTLIIDWKGLIELSKRSGEVSKWKAETVKKNDVFSWVNGEIEHHIDWRSDRGELDCVYSIVKMKDGEIDTEVMTLEEVKAIQARSQAGKSGPWVTDFEEMAKKTVIRRHSKRLTLSPEFHDALEKDADRLEPVRMATVRRELSGDENPFREIAKKTGPVRITDESPDIDFDGKEEA